MIGPRAGGPARFWPRSARQAYRRPDAPPSSGSTDESGMIGRGHQLDFYPVGIFKTDGVMAFHCVRMIAQSRCFAFKTDGVMAFPSGIRVSVKVENVYPFFLQFFRYFIHLLFRSGMKSQIQARPCSGGVPSLERKRCTYGHISI